MAMDGLLVLVCASALAGTPASASKAPDDRESAVTNALAVQTAMQQARDELLHKKTKAAVDVLESQLSKINGNPVYLGLLREAYQLYLQELHLAGQEAAAREIRRRLLILDPYAPVAKTAHAPAVSPARPTAVRGYRQDDDDPFRQNPQDKQKVAGTLLAQAELQFSNNRFREAGALFEQANQVDPSAVAPVRPRWAYCKLDHVVEALNRQSTAFTDLESEVRSALALAPQIDFARQLLTEIDRRRGSQGNGAGGNAEAANIAVRELGTNADGWSVAETTNFRVYHRQNAEIAEQAARVAEQTRTNMQRKWFGRTGPNWNPKCELYLHASAEDYSRATRVPPVSPGHSSFRIEGGRVVGRRIDLHCDDINLLTAVLPHEATHTVLAGNFGDKPVPRWADEGMAVLTEPREKIERHLRNLPRYYQDRSLFTLRQLMEMEQYPEARFVGPFYAESVSIVEFLAAERGPQVFTQFVRDGLRDGYESALEHHYGYHSFEELEEQWTQRLTSERSAARVASDSDR